MAKGINKAILIGRLGADPELRHTAGGSAVANLSVATSEQWRDKGTGEKRENTEWHRVVLFGKVAEVAGEYLSKGAEVYIEGRLQTRKWQDREGNDRWTTEIIGNDMQMLGGGRGRSGTEAGSGQIPGSARSQPEAKPEPDGLEDDIPF